MKSEDFGITLELNEKEDLTIHPLGYWPGKHSEELISSKAWDKQSRRLKLGSGGLNLTVIKPGGTKNKNITLEKMNEIRKITNLPKPNLDKVILGAKFDDSDGMFDVASDVILEKSRYKIEITDIPVRFICNQKDHIIFIDHKSNIKVSSLNKDYPFTVVLSCES